MTKKLASKGKLLKPKPNQITNRSLQLIEQSYVYDNGGCLVDEYTECHENLIKILNEKKDRLKRSFEATLL